MNKSVTMHRINTVKIIKWSFNSLSKTFLELEESLIYETI